MDASKINFKLNSIKKTYLFLSIIGVIFIFFSLIFKRHTTAELFEASISPVVGFSIYYGLKKNRDWVIPFVLLVSAGAILHQFGHLDTIKHAYGDPAGRILLPIEAVMESVIRISLTCFFAYQIYFFSKKEVRELFNVREQILF
ncbi:MAG: hypothetical protein WA666_09220 [Nitrospirota bacterium]